MSAISVITELSDTSDTSDISVMTEMSVIREANGGPSPELVLLMGPLYLSHKFTIPSIQLYSYPFISQKQLFPLVLIIISIGTQIAIRIGVGENVDTVKDDGFSLSTRGVQEIKFFKLPIITSPEDEIEQPVEIKQNTP